MDFVSRSADDEDDDEHDDRDWQIAGISSGADKISIEAKWLISSGAPIVDNKAGSQ